MENKKEPERGGDPFPEPQPYGDAPIRRRLRRRPSLLAIGVLCSLALSGVTALHAVGVYQFPGSQLFSITVQYSFAAPGQSASTFTAGSSATVTLTVQNAGNPSNLQIRYNATNPTTWNSQDINSGSCAQGTNGVCSRDLSMTDPTSHIFAPEN